MPQCFVRAAEIDRVVKDADRDDEQPRAPGHWEASPKSASDDERDEAGSGEPHHEEPQRPGFEHADLTRYVRRSPQEYEENGGAGPDRTFSTFRPAISYDPHPVALHALPPRQCSPLPPIFRSSNLSGLRSGRRGDLEQIGAGRRCASKTRSDGEPIPRRTSTCDLR